MTCQKTYKVRSSEKRSGRDRFYGSHVKRRQVKALTYKRRSRSSSVESVASDPEIKAEVSVATSRATSLDVETDSMVICASGGASPIAELPRQDEPKEALEGDTTSSDKVEEICPKPDPTVTARFMYDNGFRSDVQDPQAWQQYNPQQEVDYSYPGVPLSASSSSSFEAISSGSDASGAYSPYVANEQLFNSSYVPTPMSEAQTYPGSSWRLVTAQGFGGMPSTTYGPQHHCYGHHGLQTYEPANQFNYRRHSEQQQSLRFTPNWGNFAHAS